MECEALFAERRAGLLFWGRMKFEIVGSHLCAGSGKGERIVLLQEGDKAFADEAAEIEGGGSVVGAHDAANLHGAFREIGDLQGGGAAVPEF